MPASRMHRRDVNMQKFIRMIHVHAEAERNINSAVGEKFNEDITAMRCTDDIATRGVADMLSLLLLFYIRGSK